MGNLHITVQTNWHFCVLDGLSTAILTMHLVRG